MGSLSNTKIESLKRLQDRAVSMTHTSRIKGNWTPKILPVEQVITFDRAVIKLLTSCVKKIYGESSI